ncbi:hypothetical protein [Meridianimarinicoccus sp. MJW13]|uniref:hypothetical protein n=1 Tax=Meridianimarinicoccus sp. MJW13 TaxID=2720031 RepID=UPI00186755F4|nr:hypothetical protein [Fluviibacterium sp. MJW13]
MDASTNTTFHIDAAMDILLPPRSARRTPHTHHRLDDLGVVKTFTADPRRTTSSVFG